MNLYVGSVKLKIKPLFRRKLQVYDFLIKYSAHIYVIILDKIVTIGVRQGPQ